MVVFLENFFRLFSEINQPKIKIVTPFLWKTKADIFHIIDQVGRKDLISSTVSCSHTSRHRGATHCGGCSQCIDRKFAAYGSELDSVDDVGIYTSDFVRRGIENGEVRSTLIDYVCQAKEFASLNLNDFHLQMFSELAGFVDYIPGESEQEKVKKVWELCYRHGKQVSAAIRRMQAIHDNPFLPLPEGSFLKMIAQREYLPDPIQEQQSSQTVDSRSQPNGVKLFYAYSHRDEGLREQLENHLSILRRQGVITDWHDRKIGAGGEWEREIHKHLNTAHIILLLVSSDFLASDYCYDIEVDRAMKRHEAGEARVIPIILRSVDWEDAPFGKLQALPRDAKSVTKWGDQDEAFTNIARGIKKAIEDLNQP